MAFPWTLLIGSGGGIIKGFFESREKRKAAERADLRAEKDRAHDITMHGLETTKAINIADTKALGETIKSQDSEVSYFGTLAANAGPKMTAYMNFIAIHITAAQKMIRIILSFGFATWAWWQINELQGLVEGIETFTEEDVVTLYKMAVLSMFDLTELALSYWFTSRPTSSWKAMLGMKK